ncbi:hypothetical protein [Pandoraea sp. NPDC087047]
MYEREEARAATDAVGGTSVLDLCDMDTEKDTLQLWSFANAADEEAWTW